LGVGTEATEDVVNIPRSLAGARVAVFLYELRGDDGVVSTKVSLRTVEPYDAAEFCRERGGGGHQRAAGCTLNIPLAQAKPQVINGMHASWFSA
jgi:phosphoesterase RecJ-like protein